MRLAALLPFAVAVLAVQALLGFLPDVLRGVDPLLALAVVAALPGRPGAALAAGLLTGLTEDAWRGDWVGQQALIHSSITWALALVAARVDLVQLRPATLALVLAAIASWGLEIALALLFDRPLGQPAGPARWILAAAGTMVIGLVLRRIALAVEAFA